MIKFRMPFLLVLALVVPFVAQAEGALPVPDNAKPAMRGVLEKLGYAGPYAVELRRLYESQAYQPLWSHDGSATPQAQVMVDALVRAGERGLIAADYDGPNLKDSLTRLSSGQPSAGESWAAFDVTLSRASMRFGNHLHRGRIDVADLTKLGISIQANRPLDLPRVVSELSKSADPLRELDRLEPATGVYGALKAALAHYRALAQAAPPAPVKLAKSLHAGESSESVPNLRTLLQLNGYLDPNALPAADANLYDDGLADAVRRFQARFGLEPDGIVGGQTLKQINMTPAERLNQIRLGLERLRWLPEQRDSAYLIVNVPSFRLYGYDAGVPDLAKPDISMNVIVGEAIDTHNTPVFHADMESIAFRPYWNVPYSIAHKELLPLIEKSYSYLAKNDMEIVADDGISVGLDASQGNIDAVDHGQFRLRQRPGPKNALGPIKFVFPNMNSVYLHGTPKQYLFQRARRDFSHGCIRLADPAGLAEFVLKNENGWNRSRIESAMQGDKSFSVRLSRNVPVYIFYTTALADAQGQVLFYPDVYGQDAGLLQLLGKEGG